MPYGAPSEFEAIRLDDPCEDHSDPLHDENRERRLLPPHTGRWFALTALVSLLTIGAMCYPYEFRAPAGGAWLALEPTTMLAVLGHVALLIPFGIAEGALARRLLRTEGLIILLTVLDAALLALVGETIQRWVPAQTSSLIDLVACAIGGGVGGMIAGVFARQPGPTGGENSG